MTARPTTARRHGARPFAALAALGAALALAACSPEAEEQGGNGGGDGGGTDAPAGSSELDVEAYEALIDAAPVAEDAAVEGNAWAAQVREAGVLHRGGTETSELFSLLDPTTGTARGFDAGLADMLAKYILGEPNVELSQVTVDTREDLLVNGSVDTVIATYSITPERAERVDFAGPYYTSQTGILVAADNEDIQGVDDLDGATVSTQAASTGVTALEEFAPGAEILALPDHAQALSAVQQGRADAYVIDQALLLNAVVANDDVKVVGEPFGPGDSYGIGLPPDSGAKEFVNDWLQQIVEDDTWTELWQVTIGDRTGVEDVPEPPEIGSVEGS
ncbi:glutamate ABC transporter substrate-binding protein [Georgenia sp. TF02-10]|uniref:glutamate ABC transporter substrate-binding protein n=1 Tax=Georgenia sp. TF02-10 TaxID=2917725 RepID=UPI001FA6F760|nr:glutamate ABC transporter substrate-binding protein [Georgenia sp. TF02-10]UNX55300.1 glutamate ABC transporter substrate-binding protein [Georgenia sp. TF02-10]